MGTVTAKQTPTIAVTGASGYLGSRVVESLLNRGIHVVRCVRRPTGEDIYYSFDSPPSTKLRNVDAVIHLAWDTQARRHNELINCVRRSIELAEQTSQDGKRFVFVSSMASTNFPLSEYGSAKLQVEGRVLELGGLVVRPGLVIGEPPHGLWRLIDRISSWPIVFVPNGLRVFVVDLDRVVDSVVELALCGSAPDFPLESISLTDLIRWHGSSGIHKTRIIKVPRSAAVLAAFAMKRIAPLHGLGDSLTGVLNTPTNAQSVSGVWHSLSTPERMIKA